MRWDFPNGTWHVGDCFDVMATLPDASVDMILADLPYGTTACSWDSMLPFEPLWQEYWRIAKPNAAIVLTASQPFTSALVMSQVAAFKYEWIWKKNAGSNFGQTRYMPMKEHESVLVFYQKMPTYNAILQERADAGLRRAKHAVKMNSTGSGKGQAYGISGSVTKKITDLRVPSSVQYFNRQRGLHPTQKPAELFEYLIRTYTDLGNVVLDNTAGSGTTAVAAEQSGRKWICLERDLDYSLAAMERVCTL